MQRSEDARRLTRGPLRASAKVLPGHARRHNRELVLQTLYSAGPLSRADLARETRLTRVTISELVADLLGSGIVVELGQRDQSRPGKPATLVDVDRTGRAVVGLDLSDADVLRGSLLHLDGSVVARAERAVEAATGEDAIRRTAALARELLDRSDVPVLGVGVGTPGVVDADGVVRFAPNLGWHEVPLNRRLADELGVPVHVGNDANVALLAEHGSREHDDDFVLVKIGRGVGAGLLVAGRPQIGVDGAAGEIGHVTVGTDEGPVCVCGRRGCLEAWASAPRLRAEIAAAPDEAAREAVLSEAGRRIGIVLAPLAGALNLDEVVLSGPRELIDGPLLQAVIDTLRVRTLPEFNAALDVRLTEHGDDIVARGAAVMVLAAELGVS